MDGLKVFDIDVKRCEGECRVCTTSPVVSHDVVVHLLSATVTFLTEFVYKTASDMVPRLKAQAVAEGSPQVEMIDSIFARLRQVSA